MRRSLPRPHNQQVTCPKCGFDNGPKAGECAACGVILSKARTAAAPAGMRAAGVRPADEYERITDGRMTAGEWRILGIGAAAAVVVYAVPFTRAVGSAIVTLFHEFGHAVIGWLLGYPSLPAFDFVYGGGFTHHGQFRPSIAIALAGGFAFLAWHFRQNRKSVAIIAILFLAWLLVVSAEWRREIAIASAGHLGEFILAGILFYKALSGTGWHSPAVERPLGAFVAFFVQIHSFLFALRLTRDAEFVSWYREGKGGALMNDLEVVALDLQIRLGVQPGVEGVAGWLCILSFVPMVVALIWYFERARWHRMLRALRTVEA